MKKPMKTTATKKTARLSAANLPDEPKEPEIPNLEARVKALGTRAISAKEAWRCCVRAKRHAQLMMHQVAAHLQEAYDNQPREARGPAPLPPSVLRAVGLQVAKKTTLRVVTQVKTIPLPLPSPQTQAEVESF